MRLAQIRDTLDLVPDLSTAFLELPAWFNQSHEKVGHVEIPQDYFGVNVATSNDLACDDCVVAYLREADIQHVRLAWSRSAEDSFTQRLLNKLLENDFEVFVTLVPSRDDALVLAHDTSVQMEWRNFVRRFLETYSVSAVEIGNTPNRPRWSGFTPASYLHAWKIAKEEASQHNVELAGPNVSDFEPAFNQAYLRAMTHTGGAPDIHTTNLFVERAVQPEAYDRKALKSWLSSLASLNLVKKARILRVISERWNVGKNYSTYACWTRHRLERWSVEPERKGADYLARYLIISAATGCLDRVYWGPLIDGRDGLIECVGDAYPEIDNVTHYARVNGTVDTFRPSLSFDAFRFISQLIKGGYCDQAVTSNSRLNYFVFVTAEFEHHVLWTCDRQLISIANLYGTDIEGAGWRNVTGEQISETDQVGESPVVLSWPVGESPPRPDPERIAACKQVGPRGTQFNWTGKPQTIDEGGWQGVIKVPKGVERSVTLTPMGLKELPATRMLRDKRNKLWTVKVDGLPNDLVIKENRARGVKRFSYYFLQSKGMRHWNNAQELLRRGIRTPTPVGFFERSRRASTLDNYYIAEYIADTYSTRDLFTAFQTGEEQFAGIGKVDWLQHLAAFIGHMHKKRVFHRDLSSGNILFTVEDGKPEFFLIDIGRARFGNNNNYYGDISRICYKLGWPDRECLMQHYGELYPSLAIKSWRWQCQAYDAKMRLKKALKGVKKKKVAPG